MPGELLNVAEQFNGLPMEDLIAGPLMAACDAQVKLAKSEVQFIQEVGLVQDVDKDGKPVGPMRTREVSFTSTRPVTKGDGTIGEETTEMQVPLLAVVPVPALMIDTVDINFEMEVKSSFKTEQNTDYKAAIDISAGWGPFSVKIHGEVASHSAQTRTSDNSAKYSVRVLAKQAPVPEGLMKVLDYMVKSCEPRSITPTPAADTTPAKK